MSLTSLKIHHLGLQDYQTIYASMQEFTHQRDHNTIDELWFLEHYPVFTQGKAGKTEHILQRKHIPIIQTDRGGQVTYHAPGQLIVYFLLDLHRRKINIRQLVDLIEQSLISLLAQNQIPACTIAKQPGVYVDSTSTSHTKATHSQGNKQQVAKIASLGIHIHKGCSYHGLSLNVNMDLQPFTWINTCGIKQLKITQLSDLGCYKPLATISHELAPIICDKLSTINNSIM